MEVHETIKGWPISQRPRERLLALGAPRLNEAELLAILLGTGSSKRGEEGNAVVLARRTLNDFGGLSGLLKAGTGELLKMGGIGPAKVARIQAALELGRRLGCTLPGEQASFSRSEDVFREYGRRYISRRREVLLLILLDTRQLRIRDFEVSEGGLSAAVVHPRDVFLPAIREAAASLICVHNHPSGDPSPSSADIATTRRLAFVGNLVGIPVLDHVILGDNCYYSLADNGLMDHNDAQELLESDDPSPTLDGYLRDSIASWEEGSRPNNI